MMFCVYFPIIISVVHLTNTNRLISLTNIFHPLTFSNVVQYIKIETDVRNSATVSGHCVYDIRSNVALRGKIPENKRHPCQQGQAPAILWIPLRLSNEQQFAKNAFICCELSFSILNALTQCCRFISYYLASNTRLLIKLEFYYVRVVF